MINIFKKRETNKIESKENKYRKFLREKEEVIDIFDEYDLEFDDCFFLIYNNSKDMKDTMIIASYLRQIEPSLEVVKEAYSLSDKYINDLIRNEVPQLRVKAYKMVKEVIPNAANPFGWNNNVSAVYLELIDIIDYLFEVKRSQNKINADNRISFIKDELLNNPQILLLLNLFDTKDTLIIASNLGIVNIHEDELHRMYEFDENRFNDLITGENMLYIEEILTKRIKKLDSIELEDGYFDYEGLLNNYKQLFNLIDDTKKYIWCKKKI